MLLVIEIIFGFWLLLAVCFIDNGNRKIPVQYARRTTSGDFEQI
jgi:preprotein translocase subunit SecY